MPRFLMCTSEKQQKSSYTLMCTYTGSFLAYRTCASGSDLFFRPTDPDPEHPYGSGQERQRRRHTAQVPAVHMP